MLAYKVPKGRLTDPINSVLDGTEGIVDLHDWRKHPNLHGWMEQLYREKGGEKEFNCVNLQLTEEDLDKLENDIRDSNLPETHGFFFGESTTGTQKGDLEFITVARQSINEGSDVYYTSWW